MKVIMLFLLIFIAGMVCAIANFIVRQQEVALEPSVEQTEEDEDEDEE